MKKRISNKYIGYSLSEEALNVVNSIHFLQRMYHLNAKHYQTKYDRLPERVRNKQSVVKMDDDYFEVILNTFECIIEEATAFDEFTTYVDDYYEHIYSRLNTLLDCKEYLDGIDEADLEGFRELDEEDKEKYADECAAQRGDNLDAPNDNSKSDNDHWDFDLSLDDDDTSANNDFESVYSGLLSKAERDAFDKELGIHYDESGRMVFDELDNTSTDNSNDDELDMDDEERELLMAAAADDSLEIYFNGTRWVKSNPYSDDNS